MATILTKKSDTASAVPLAADLTNAAGGAELAVNATDKRLFSKTSGGTVVELGTNPSSLTLPNGTANGLAFLNASKVVTSGSALTFDGTNLGVGGTGAVPLDVYANSSALNLRLRGRSADSIGQMEFWNNAGSTRYGYLSSESTAITLATVGALPMVFVTNGSERMRLDSSGNLGIGTSSPAAKFDAFQSSVGTYFLGGGGDNKARQLAITSSTTTNSGDTHTLNAQSGTGVLAFAISSSEKMRLDTSGNLGLGVTPSAWNTAGSTRAFEFINGSSSTTGSVAGWFGSTNILNNAIFSATGGGTMRYVGNARALHYQQNGSDGSHLWFNAPSGTAGNAITFTQAMTLDASGNLGIGTTSPAAKLMVIGAGGASLYIDSSAGGNNIYDATNHIWRSNSGGSERARIDSSGNLLCGTTGTSWTDTVGFYAFYQSAVNATRNGAEAMNLNRLTSDGTILGFRRSGTQVGSVSVTTTATAYNTSSDYRLKDNPKNLTGSGEFIDALKPKTWNWKIDGSKGVGFLAHEAQAVSPSSVSGQKDAIDEKGNPIMQAMEYGSAEFIANIIAELQSLRQRVAQLEAQ